MTKKENIIEKEIKMETGFSKIIIVDNIPIIPQEKFEKLKNLLLKIFNTIGTVKQIYMPKDEKNITKGYHK